MDSVMTIDMLKSYLLDHLSESERELVQNLLLENPEDFLLINGLLNLGCDRDVVDASDLLLGQAKRDLKRCFYSHVTNDAT